MRHSVRWVENWRDILNRYATPVLIVFVLGVAAYSVFHEELRLVVVLNALRLFFFVWLLLVVVSFFLALLSIVMAVELKDDILVGRNLWLKKIEVPLIDVVKAEYCLYCGTKGIAVITGPKTHVFIPLCSNNLDQLSEQIDRVTILYRPTPRSLQNVNQSKSTG